MNLDRFYESQTDYIDKLNNNSTKLENGINANTQDIADLKAASSPGSDLDFRLNSFNLTINGSLDYWQRGAYNRPDAWINENISTLDIERVQNTELAPSNVYLNTYSMSVTGNGLISQKLNNKILKSLENNQAVSFGCWLKTNEEDSVRVGLYNGSYWQWSLYAINDDLWNFLSVNIIKTSGVTEIKFGVQITNLNTDKVLVNGLSAIKGNPSAEPLFIANDPTIEQLRVLSLYEEGITDILGVGILKNNDRVLNKRINFVAPKKLIPNIFLSMPDTGYEIAYKDVDIYGFTLVVTEIEGYSGTNGFEYLDITWIATVSEV